MAKKVSKKQPATRRTVAKSTRKTTAPGTAARKTAKKTAKKKAASPPAATRTARKKTAARGAATRKRRTEPSPAPPSKMATAATAVRGGVKGVVAAVSARMPWGRSGPDAIQLLEHEHRRFEDLLKQGEETTERAKKTRGDLLDTLSLEMNAHELMEEKVLYPALQSHPEAREIVLEGYEEHHVADLIMEELRGVATDDEQWAAKFKVLKENIEHHIEEEEGEMFRTARGLFSREEMQELAARMLGLRNRTPAPKRKAESR